MPSKNRYLVTSALPYANGPLHIGHLAGAYISADIFVRYLRLMGKDVVWVCGSDEHGAAITIRAMKEGLSPREIIDKYDAMFRAAFKGMGVSFDIFHRTSEPIHYQTSQDFFRKLNDNGQFDVIENEQYFDEEKQLFLADRYIIGVCPVCENPDAYGDQCERCGSALSPNDLKSPIRSTLSGSTPIKKVTKHWYLKLNEYENWLRRWITEGTLEMPEGSENLVKTHDPATWKAHVLGQCRSWLDQGLQPRAMTRDLDWGIPVPPEIDKTGKKKLYVWLDAPIGYISATKQWAIDQGDAELWRKYWQAEDTALIHFVGKDNIVFHCLIFPAMLREHGGYVLPENVPANQFMNLEGRKISTSKNWAVWVHEYLADFAGKEDVLRYAMIKNMPEQKDSEFTWKAWQEANNSELVGNFANFVNRVVVLTNKFYVGKIPQFVENTQFSSSSNPSVFSTFSDEILKILAKSNELAAAIERYDFRGAIQVLMEISTVGNQILQFNEPWKKIKNPEDSAVVAAVMNVSLQIVAVLSVAARPFLPFTSDAMRKMLNINELQDKGELAAMLETLKNGQPLLPVGHQIGEPLHLFSRIGDEVVAAQIEKLKATDEENSASKNKNETEKMDNNPQPTIHNSQLSTPQYEPLKSAISYDEFAKMDIRTGKIIDAEAMPKSDKLLKLTIDLGFETRTILSGIAKHFSAESIVGRQVVVLANLAPRKMMGVESNGMVLMAENAEGKLALVAPTEDWANGATVK